MKRAELKVEPRETNNRSLNRGLRKFGRVPAVVYAGGKSGASVSFEEKEIRRIVNNEWNANFIFTLQSEDAGLKGKQVIVKNLERDPVTWRLMHVDFYELSFDRPLTVTIPIRFSGTPQGVKLEGGILNIVRRSVKVKALPNDLPEIFEIDLSPMKIGDSFHIGELQVADSVTMIDPTEATIVSVVEPSEEEPKAVTEAPEGEEGEEGESAEGEEGGSDEKKAE